MLNYHIFIFTIGINTRNYFYNSMVAHKGEGIDYTLTF